MGCRSRLGQGIRGSGRTSNGVLPEPGMCPVEGAFMYLHCTNGPTSSPFTCDSALPLTKEAKCTSLLIDFRFGHLAGGTRAGILAKGSAFSVVHCHGKTRHRPACSSGGDEGTEMNRPSCALPTHCPGHPHLQRGLRRAAELPSGAQPTRR